MSQIPAFALHALVLSTLLAISHTLLKWVAEQGQGDYLGTLLNHWFVVVISLSLYGFIFFYYVFILKTSSLSLLYPVYTGLSILFVFIAGRLFFGEELGAIQQLGAVLVVFGVVMMGKG